MDQGTKHTPKFAKQGMSIDTSAHALKRNQSVASHGKTPLSTTIHQSLLRTPTTGHDEKEHSDMGEMGYLHLRVHCLVNLDNGIASEAKPDLTRALFSAELVTSDYNRKKTIFTNGDITKHHAWGDGLYFRIFQVLVLSMCWSAVLTQPSDVPWRHRRRIEKLNSSSRRRKWTRTKVAGPRAMPILASAGLPSCLL